MNESIDLIEECLDHESNLTQWELEFLDSITTQLERGSLTDTQESKLQEIVSRVTNAKLS